MSALHGLFGYLSEWKVGIGEVSSPTAVADVCVRQIAPAALEADYPAAAAALRALPVVTEESAAAVRAAVAEQSALCEEAVLSALYEGAVRTQQQEKAVRCLWGAFIALCGVESGSAEAVWSGAGECVRHSSDPAWAVRVLVRALLPDVGRAE